MGHKFHVFCDFPSSEKNEKKNMKKGRHYDGFDGGSGGMRGATGGFLGGQKQARIEPRVSARPSSPASGGRADSKRFAHFAGPAKNNT